jgi:hypothetical protein
MQKQHSSCELPLCPGCSEPMVLIQTWSSLCGFPQRCTFECKRCDIEFTEVTTGESAIQERVIALHHEIYHAPN